MTERAEVELAFARLKTLGEASELIEGGYVVERIDRRGTRFLARSSDGASALIVTTVSGSAVPPLRLEGLSADYGIDCLLVEHGKTTELRASVVRSSSKALASRDLFATLCASLADSLAVTATDQELATEIDRWARLFWRLTQPATAELLGLAGELACIAQASDKESWVRAWHSRPDDRFDFAFLPGPGVIEVKATSRDRRIHEISLAQVQGPQLESRFIASLRVVDGGTSLGELVRSISEQLHSDQTLLSLWNVLTLTCGTSLNDALAFGIDYEVAKNSMRYYRASSVSWPAVELPLPVGVTNVRFSVDLDRSEPVDRGAVEETCTNPADT